MEPGVLGVTREILEYLLSRIRHDFRDDHTVVDCAKFAKDVVLPSIERTSVSFAETILQDPGALADDAGGVLGEATVYVTHAWDAPVVELLETLLRYGDNEEQPTYFWLDLCCSTQNVLKHYLGDESARIPWETCQAFISANIRTCKELLVVATPYAHPQVCKRAWCVFEVATAVARHVPVHLAIPQAQEEILQRDAMRNIDVVSNVMRAIDCKTASTSVPQDTTSIRDFLQAMEGGSQTVDDMFTTLLKQWILDTLQRKALAEAHGTKVKAQLAVYVASAFLRTGHHDAAIDFFNQAIAVYTMLGSDASDVRTCLSGIGTAYKEKGECGRAINFYARALALEEKEFGPHDCRTLGTLMGLGSVNMQRGDYNKAVDFYKRSLEGKLATLGRFDKQTAQTYMGLGSAYKYMGDFKGALEHYTEALLIQQTVCDSNHPDIADTCMGLGSTHMQMGRYADAISCYERSLVGKRKSLGLNHASTAQTYMGLASALSYVNQFDKAIATYRTALQIQRTVFGENEHPDIAQTLMGLGSAHMKRRELEEAVECYTESLSIKLKILGSNHADTAATYTGLGSVWMLKGDYDRALDYYKTALDIDIRVLGEDHTEVGQVLSGLGTVYGHLGDTVKSKETYTQSYQNLSASLGEQHPQVLALKQYMDTL
eukprot:m.617952 g.617952  ORF g.617952 m.617952 type:complete len:659 (+) comp22525_c0_seq4:358-2334(+)